MAEPTLEDLANEAVSVLLEAPDENVREGVGTIVRHIQARELHHFETEQENEKLKAENEKLHRELLATNNYAILQRGSGWDSSFDLISWDEEDYVWKVNESDLSKGAVITLRDTYNARRQDLLADKVSMSFTKQELVELRIALDSCGGVGETIYPKLDAAQGR